MTEFLRISVLVGLILIYGMMLWVIGMFVKE
jgi:hypothetical protein